MKLIYNFISMDHFTVAGENKVVPCIGIPFLLIMFVFCKLVFLSIISIRKGSRFVSKHGQTHLNSHSLEDYWLLSPQL